MLCLSERLIITSYNEGMLNLRVYLALVYPPYSVLTNSEYVSSAVIKSLIWCLPFLVANLLLDTGKCSVIFLILTALNCDLMQDGTAITYN